MDPKIKIQVWEWEEEQAHHKAQARTWVQVKAQPSADNQKPHQLPNLTVPSKKRWAQTKVQDSNNRAHLPHREVLRDSKDHHLGRAKISMNLNCKART